MKKLYRVLCLLGFHSWLTNDDQVEQGETGFRMRHCRRCTKIQVFDGFADKWKNLPADA